jgi:predicted DCC family thiol-disulfide oxidoreductase YuxK
MMPQKTPVTIYYNTKCPVCDFGINAQKNRLVQAVIANEIEFRDINLEPHALLHFGASVDDVRRRLHATDKDGSLIVGADVAVLLWRLTDGQNWLALLFGNALMLPITRFGYDRFADILFAWNKLNKRF